MTELELKFIQTHLSQTDVKILSTRGGLLLKDIEYIKDLLQKDYLTERQNEIPHPPLDQVIQSLAFDYLKGTVEGEEPNGEKSREGKPYLWFKHGSKSILSHRFIAAVTLGKWIPRECHIDHINHDPSDNRPINLRITTPRDNVGNRRTALLSELADIDSIQAKLKEINQAPVVQVATDVAPAAGSSPRRQEQLGSPKYTGETQPGTFSGTYFGTTFGSWHWYADGTAPASKDFA